MTVLHFTKMHGLGNDFIIINNLQNSIDSLKNLSIPLLSNRHLGIGFDQLLLLEKSTSADVFCRIFNADGSEAEQCGNGMRCVARFMHEEKLSTNNTIRIETKAGIVSATIADYDHIQITMGVPAFDHNHLHEIILNQSTSPIEMTVLSMGNPHAIIHVPSIQSCPIKQWGPEIATHLLFPQGTNVGFMEIMSRQHIRLRTYERGVGETVACGSNACAAVVAGILNGLLDTRVTVELHFGNLLIEWKDKGAPVVMTGPASRVFSGNLM